MQGLSRRFVWFAPATIASELRVDDVPGPISAAAAGWLRLPDRSPRLYELVRSIHADPHALAVVLATTPQTFVAGDWKLGNLGSRRDGRTILLDWAYPGEAPPCWELAWYLALNCDRLPRSKEETIAAYRRGLEERGVDTAGWWDRQLGLCMVGMMATMAWEKALGDDRELRWWESAALAGVALVVRVMVADPARRAYAGGGSAWANDASLVYEPLARHLIARFPTPLTDLRVLDAGAGTGAAGSVLAAHGARVVETDVEPTMLDHARSARPAAAAADVAALPFRSGVFDAAVAAFVLNHVAAPTAGLAELARVTRPGGFVLASTFAASRSAVKVAFDNAARCHGWRSPAWHDVVSARQTAFSTLAHARSAASEAGLVDVIVTEAAIDVGVDDAESIVRYRLGMPQYAAWLGELDDRERDWMVADAITAIEDLGEPFRPLVIELVARVT